VQAGDRPSVALFWEIVLILNTWDVVAKREISNYLLNCGTLFVRKLITLP
jgi:hypothetical protein